MARTATLTRRFRFCASHRYHDPALSAEENRRRFGLCANEHGHGHNYVLEVSVRGPVEPRTGMILDLLALDALVHGEVLARYDHRHLNLDVEDFAGTQPTTEAIALCIWDRLEGHLPGGQLARVRVYETDDLFAEVTR